MTDRAVVTDLPKCRHVATDEPRILPGRHGQQCPDKQVRTTGAAEPKDTCPGCLPCPLRHCLSCGHRHAEVTCATCTGEARSELEQIVALCDRVWFEIPDRTESEVVMLHGPTAHPEAWYHVADSVREGRIRGDVEANLHEDHPAWVLGWWEICYRDQLGHESSDAITVRGSADYLGEHLSEMADRLEPPFSDFAADLRRCRGHLEDVLRDRDPRPKDCPKCGGALVMDHDEAGKDEGYAEGNLDREYDDRWKCRNKACRAWWTDHDYRVKVEASYEAHADRLTASAIARVYRVAEGTVRQWASREKVRKRGTDSRGRMLYDVADVVRARDERDGEEAG